MNTNQVTRHAIPLGLLGLLGIGIGLLLLGTPVNSAVAGTTNPVPLINQPLVPDAVAPGGAGFTLTVNGTGFVIGSVVDWNGSARATTFVSGSQLTAVILASDIAAANTSSITVVNPSPGGGTSNVVFFSITLPTSSISLSRSDLPTSSEPSAVAPGDFNGDGKLDLAVVDFGSDKVSILLGNGDGTFQTHVDYGTGSAPGVVVVGDFNGDGTSDIAIRNEGSNTVSILLGNGDGTFQAAASYTTGSSGAGGLNEGDFNGDGKLDLAVMNYDKNTVSILLGNGDGTFQKHVDYATASGPFQAAVGDFNSDGKLDLAVVNNTPAGTFSVLLGNGDGTFQTHVDYSTIANPNSVVAGDFNGDGKLDLAIFNEAAEGATGLSILLGNGDGTFQTFADYATGCGPGGTLCTATAADLNGDGKLDLAVRNSDGGSNNTVSILLGNGDGTFQSPLAYATGHDPQEVVAGDFNNDGRLDLAVANFNDNTVSVLLQATTVALSNTSLKFPVQLIGSTSAAQTVTLTNTGPITLTISSIATSGDFLQTNNCGSSVAAGASCNIDVSFKPKAKGTRTGTLTITDNAASSPQTLALAGIGTVVQLSPALVDFGNQKVGTTSPPQTITLTNTGTAPLSIQGIAIAGTDFGDFVESTTCTSSLAAKASCTVNVTFTPMATGTRRASLKLQDDGGGSPQRVKLTGTGTSGSKAKDQPAVMLVPSSLTFPTELLGQKSTVQMVTLTNTGNATLNLTSVALTGSDPTDFHEGTTCGHTLGAGASCTFSLYFQPSKRGNRTASLTITDDAPDSPQSVPLSGAGTFVKVVPASVNFGSQIVGTTSNPQTITVTNISVNGTVNISQIVIPGTGGSFAQTNNCPAGLTPGASCTASVTFTPISKGAKSAMFEIYDNGGGSPQVVSLTGTGTSGSKAKDQPAVMLVPSSLTFPTELLGQKSTVQMVTLTNTGNATLNLTSLALTGSDPTDFHEGTTCGHTLGAGASCTFSLYFQPTKRGNRTASLTITDDAPDSPQSVPLSGAGTFVKVVPQSLSFGNQIVGTMSSPQTITVTNISVNATLTISSIIISGNNSGSFSLTNGCPTNLAPQGTCSLSVVFQPQSGGAKSATLNIFDNGGGSPQTVALSGTGT